MEAAQLDLDAIEKWLTDPRHTPNYAALPDVALRLVRRVHELEADRDYWKKGVQLIVADRRGEA